jgi:presenilin-like A22 family membrane protease
MKHEIKITIVLLLMFVLTQLIGLYVIDAYSPKITTQIINGTSTNVTVSQEIPYGMQPPEMKPQISLISIIISFVIAILIFFLLTKMKSRIALKVWFTLVIYITLAISLYAIILKLFPGLDANALALVLAIPLTFYKAIRPNLVVHNATELLVYPGLAAVFVPILNTWSIIVLLVIISIYDMYAVWKSSLMVNLAKYQIKTMKVFTGFFVPYLPKGKVANFRSAKGRGKRIKIAIAILGGGDVAFPLIFAGVLYRAVGLIPALMVIAGATLALMGLFLYSRKGKFYPAMPFITAGCLLAWLLTLII